MSCLRSIADGGTCGGTRSEPRSILLFRWGGKERGRDGRREALGAAALYHRLIHSLTCSFPPSLSSSPSSFLPLLLGRCGRRGDDGHAPNPFLRGLGAPRLEALVAGKEGGKEGGREAGGGGGEEGFFRLSSLILYIFEHTHRSTTRSLWKAPTRARRRLWQRYVITFSPSLPPSLPLSLLLSLYIYPVLLPSLPFSFLSLQVKRCMEHPNDNFGLGELMVKLEVDAKIAKSWYEAK